MNVLGERVVGGLQREFDEAHEDQVVRQARVLNMMQKMELLDNVVIGPWLKTDEPT